MKKKHMLSVAVVMAGLMMAGQVFAMAAVPSLLMDTRAISVNGMLADDGEDVEISLNGSYGYFFKDFTQAGFSAGLDVYGSDYMALNASVFCEYSFDLGGQLVPYTGASVGFIWVDSDGRTDSPIEMTGYGGARYFFVDYAAIGARAVVEFATEDIYNGGQDYIDWAVYLDTSWYF
jgi:hypothetical protein